MITTTRATAMAITAAAAGALNLAAAGPASAECLQSYNHPVLTTSSSSGSDTVSILLPVLTPNQDCGGVPYHGGNDGQCLSWSPVSLFTGVVAGTYAEIFAAAPDLSAPDCSPDPL